MVNVSRECVLNHKHPNKDVRFLVILLMDVARLLSNVNHDIRVWQVPHLKTVIVCLILVLIFVLTLNESSSQFLRD